MILISHIKKKYFYYTNIFKIHIKPSKNFRKEIRALLQFGVF